MVRSDERVGSARRLYDVRLRRVVSADRDVSFRVRDIPSMHPCLLTMYSATGHPILRHMGRIYWCSIHDYVIFKYMVECLIGAWSLLSYSLILHAMFACFCPYFPSVQLSLTHLTNLLTLILFDLPQILLGTTSIVPVLFLLGGDKCYLSKINFRLSYFQASHFSRKNSWKKSAVHILWQLVKNKNKNGTQQGKEN